VIVASAEHQAQAEATIERTGADVRSRLSLTIAPEVVPMASVTQRQIVSALRLDSTQKRAISLVASGEAAAVVSTGSTGVFAGQSARLLTARQAPHDPEQKRIPSLVVRVPRPNGGHLLVTDVGLQRDVDPLHYLHFAATASDLAPALLDKYTALTFATHSMGQEVGKGPKHVTAGHQHVVGAGYHCPVHAEAKHILEGAIDDLPLDAVLVDGPTGNALLKMAEAATQSLRGAVREELRQTPWMLQRWVLYACAAVFKPTMQRAGRRRQRAVGAAVVGGLEQLAYKLHGGAQAEDVRDGLLQAHEMTQRLHMSRHTSPKSA
jgi:fatty acid/phospholipid biosynthesis enzyme